MADRDRLVSTAVLRERRARLREQIAEQKRTRSEDDPFFKIAEWVLAEWEQAERDAAKEYVPTAEASKLTGWAPQTLRKYAAAARAGERMLEGWGELQVRRTGSSVKGDRGDWAFVVSTIPVKTTAAA
jgi:hypothetical protein